MVCIIALRNNLVQELCNNTASQGNIRDLALALKTNFCSYPMHAQKEFNLFCTENVILKNTNRLHENSQVLPMVMVHEDEPFVEYQS